MTRYGCQPFCRPAQTYIVCILIGLESCTGIQSTSGNSRDDRQNPVLNTKSLSPLYGGIQLYLHNIITKCDYDQVSYVFI